MLHLPATAKPLDLLTQEEIFNLPAMKMLPASSPGGPSGSLQLRSTGAHSASYANVLMNGHGPSVSHMRP